MIIDLKKKKLNDSYSKKLEQILSISCLKRNGHQRTTLMHYLRRKRQYKETQRGIEKMEAAPEDKNGDWAPEHVFVVGN